MKQHAGLTRARLSGDIGLSAIAEHDYVQLGGAVGLTVLSAWALTETQSPGWKVAFGVTTTLLGFIALAKAFETF